MKYLVQTACAALLGVFGVSTYSYAVENGINYDPTHSSDYVEAQKKNNIGLMVTIINMDLNEIKNKMGFT